MRWEKLSGWTEVQRLDYDQISPQTAQDTLWNQCREHVKRTESPLKSRYGVIADLFMAFLSLLLWGEFGKVDWSKTFMDRVEHLTTLERDFQILLSHYVETSPQFMDERQEVVVDHAHKNVGRAFLVLTLVLVLGYFCG